MNVQAVAAGRQAGVGGRAGHLSACRLPGAVQGANMGRQLLGCRSALSACVAAYYSAAIHESAANSDQADVQVGKNSLALPTTGTGIWTGRGMCAYSAFRPRLHIFLPKLFPSCCSLPFCSHPIRPTC